MTATTLHAAPTKPQRFATLQRLPWTTIGIILNAILIPLMGGLRIWFGHGWQIFQAWWGGADDGLLVREAIGESPADQLTLSKRPGYPIFLRVVHFTHIPLTVAIALMWIVGGLCAAWMIWRITRNTILPAIGYVMTVWCPMGFDHEVGQRAYRGSVLTPSILILAVSLVCLFLAVEWWGRLGWSIMTGVSGGFIWLLKEDSAWIIPMIAVALTATLIKAMTGRQRMMLVILPILPAILIPMGGDTLARDRNQRNYGVDLLDTRTEGELAGFVERVYRIQTPDHSYRLWAPDTAINLAIDNTTDLEKLRPYLLQGAYREGFETNGIRGDYLTWQLRYAIQAAYGEWPSEHNLQLMFAKANQQLDESAERGSITYMKGFSPSKLASTLTTDDITHRVLPMVPNALMQTVWPTKWTAPHDEERHPTNEYEQNLHDTYLAYINETDRPIRHTGVAQWIVRIWKIGMVGLLIAALIGLALGFRKLNPMASISIAFTLYAILYTFFGAWFLVFLHGDGMWGYVAANTTPLILTALLAGMATIIAKPQTIPAYMLRKNRKCKAGRHSVRAMLEAEMEAAD